MQAAASLPAALDIYHVTELREQWTQVVASCGAAAPEQGWRFDGSGVDQVDAAGLQLLVALAHSLALKHRTLHIVDASAPLVRACAALGITHLLAAAVPAQGAGA